MPIATTAATAATRERPASQTGIGSVKSIPPCAPSPPCPDAATPWSSGMASRGSSARIGITATSCTSSTEKLASPPSLRRRFFSVSVWTMIAVDESARMSAMASAVCHGFAAISPIAKIAAVVSSTCPPPSPASLPRMSHRRAGSISRPIMKSIITTPNSANTCSASTSTFSAPSSGLIAMPASR